MRALQFRALRVEQVFESLYSEKLRLLESSLHFVARPKHCPLILFRRIAFNDKKKCHELFPNYYSFSACVGTGIA